MAFKVFLIYSLVVVTFLWVAMASQWRFDIPSASAGNYGYRGTSGAWNWGGGK